MDKKIEKDKKEEAENAKKEPPGTATIKEVVRKEQTLHQKKN